MNGKIRKGRRLLSLLLVLTLCLTLMPAAVLADETLSTDSEVSAYTVCITLPEGGVETAEDSGELTQTVSAGEAMADICLVSTYEDEPFDESYADVFNARLFEGTGLSANCDEDGVITISGTPAADVTVNLAEAFAEDEPVTVADTSSDVYVSSSGDDSTGNGTQEKPYATISKAYTAVATGGTIYLLSDVDVSSQIIFNSQKTVTITSSGNRKTIKSNVTSTRYEFNSNTSGADTTFTNVVLDGSGQTTYPGAITMSAGTVTLGKDALIQNYNFPDNANKEHGSGISGVSVIYLQNGGARLNISGATITKCKIERGYWDNPSAIITVGSGATVFMTSGTITGNSLQTYLDTTSGQERLTAIINVGRYSNPHFWMTGGTITGNDIGYGYAAVYMRGEATACDIEFGDTAYVYDNKATDESQRNIYLKNITNGAENSKIYIKLCSALTAGAKLGVYAEAIGMATKVAQGGGINGGSHTATAQDSTYFVSDKATDAEILYCGGDGTTCGLLQHRDNNTNHNSGVNAIYLSVSPEVTATKGENDTITLDITRCDSSATYVVLDKDMKPVTGATLTGGAYETDGNGTFKLSNADTTTTISMPGLDKANGPYTVMLVGDGSLTVDSTTGKASTENLTDIATVNIVNFAGDGVIWSDGENNSFENGGYDIVIVPHNDQTGKATKSYTATAKTGYAFATENAIAAEGNLGELTATKDTDDEKYNVSVTVPAYGATNYNTVTLTGSAEKGDSKITIKDVKVGENDATGVGTLSESVKVTLDIEDSNSYTTTPKYKYTVTNGRTASGDVTVTTTGEDDEATTTYSIEGLKYGDHVKVYVEGEEGVSPTYFKVLNTAIENGGFENVTGTGYELKTGVGVAAWRTTANDQNIEVYPVGSYGVELSPNEGYVAELNATEVSSLYQEISTTPGETLGWTMYHTARSNGGEATQSMAIIVGPTLDATDTDPYKNTSANTSDMFMKIAAQITDPVVGETYYTTYEGKQYQVTIASDTKSGRSWKNYSGTYTVPAGQTETVFAFASLGTATGDNAKMGNLIDGVGFGTGVPITAVAAAKNRSDTSKLDISIENSTKNGVYVVLNKDMKPVKGTLTGGGYVGDTATFKLSSEDDNTTVSMAELDKGSGPYTVMRVLSGTLSLDDSGEASTGNLTDIATVNIVNFAGDGVTWSDGENNSFENGGYDIVIVPHDDQTGKANKSYTATAKSGYAFAAENAITAEGDLNTASVTDNDNGSKTVSVVVPAYGTTSKGTSGYSSVTLTGTTVLSTGVKLLDKTGGTEMTDGKTYDGAAVAYTAPTIDGMTLSYTWQKKDADGNYSGIDENAAPSDAGDYNLKVTAKSSSDSSKVLGEQNLPFTISQKELGVTVNATNKTYDGTTVAAATVTLNTGDVVTNDNVTLDGSNKNANFDSEAVGENKTVTVTGLKLTGTDAANYKLPDTITTTASITKANGSGTVTMQGWTYGSTENEPQPTSMTNGTDNVTYKYKVKDATEYLTGVPTAAGNYTVEATFPANDNYNEVVATSDFTINPKTLTVNVTAANKTYDGEVTAQLNTATLSGVETADVSKVTLVANDVTAAFSDANAGNDKTVTLTGNYALTGDAAGNYTLTQPTGLTASITKASHTDCTLSTEGDRGAENTFSVPNENIVAGGTVGTITVSDTDTIFDGTPTYSNGTLTYKLKSTAADSQTATVTLPVTSTNYDNYNIVVTVTVKSKETVAITITAADVGYVYNGETQTPTFTVTGATVDKNSLDVTYTGRDETTYESSDAAPTNAGKYTMTVKVPDSNTQYTGSATCYFEIAKKTLTASITAENKTYDGKTAATVTPTLTGVVGSESVTATASNAAFGDKNVGTGKKVTASISLTGDAAGNYTVNEAAETTASITAKEVSITGVTVANSKTYDKTTTAEITNTGTISGMVSTDSVTITGGTASYENAIVGTNKTVNFSGFTLSGTDAGNYELKEQPASTTADITAKEVTVSGVTIDATKVYDGNANAKITGGGTLTGVEAGDTVTLKTGTATYNDKNVGASKTVTFSGFELEGADKGNYKLTSQPTATTAAITPREVTISGLSATKTYDGDATATESEITGIPAIGGKALDTDDVSVSTAGMAGTFDTSAVGENKTVTITGLSLTGADKDNYKLPTTVTCTGTITKANGSGTVTMQGWTYGSAANEPQPNSTTNPGTVTYKYKVKGAEDGTYSDTVPTAAGEYTVKATFPANANYGEATDTADFTISPKELTVNVTAANKTYDGEVTAQLNTATLSGVLEADNGKVSLDNSTVSASFKNANAGENKPIALTGAYTLTGDAAENYTLTQPSGLTANINKKVLTITPKDVSISRGTTPTFELDYVGLVGEESVTLADPTYTVKNSSGDAITMDDAIKTAGTYSVTVGGALTGDGAGNYEYVSGTGTLTVKRPSSGGGSTSVDSGKFDVPVSGDKTAITIEGEINGKTVVVSEVTSKDIETVGEGENVVIELESLNSDINSAKLTVGTLENVLNSDAEGLEIRLPNAIVTIDKTTLEALTEQAIDDLQLVIEPDEAARKTLNSAQEKSISELVRPTIVEAFFTSFGNRISDFKGGEVSVSVPFYTDKPIRAWYLKEDGTREKVGAVYDKVHATLTLTHFSHYAIEELENEDYNVAYASCPKDATCPIEPFPDAVNKEWYHDGCHFCIDNGLMVGFPDGNFYPYGDVTRAQVVTILWRLEGSLETDSTMNFADVPDGKWFTEAIRWATSSGIVTGYSDKSFGPNDAITREQFASILWRYSKLKGYDVSVGENTDILDYEDASKVSSYAVSAMQWACGSGMISGVTSDTLVPGGVTSRAQAATMFMRYCAEIVK